MAGRFNRTHFDVSGWARVRPYKSHRPKIPAENIAADRKQRAQRLRTEFARAIADFEQGRPRIEGIEPADGAYLDVEVTQTRAESVLSAKTEGRRTGAVQIGADGTAHIALFVPSQSQQALDRRFDEFENGDIPASGHPPHSGLVRPIRAIREATFDTFWTDGLARLPAGRTDVIWWEVWTDPESADALAAQAHELGLAVRERDAWMEFPAATIVPVLTDRNTIEAILFSNPTITELRRGSDTPFVFTDMAGGEQRDWSDDLAERTTWPGTDVPAVTLLDTGVNRGHVLIEPALAASDLFAVRSEWGEADSDGHGTGMAGIALHGDLTDILADTSERTLHHRLESVKLMAPPTADPVEERSYGPLTQAAIVLPEIENPQRPRVHCLAITNENVSGSRPTSWSAALDQAAAGAMPGDEDRKRRLILVSGGNVPSEIEQHRIIPASEAPIEDPAQAWNAITVSGYTDKITIDPSEAEGLRPLVDAGDLSPHARSSEAWPLRVPAKPDIVMEAGNRALDADAGQVSNLDSLDLLSTGHAANRPLVAFRATSAAVAAAARLGARLLADHSHLWPETIRALIVHSAEWTPLMRGKFKGLNKTDALRLRRHYGYGVPDYDRATASAQNHLAILAQQEIQPNEAKRNGGFEECHVYALPWPRTVLEELGDVEVSLKVTLSYFVDPSPSGSGAVDPARYRSHGLRFDLRRRQETEEAFLARVNAEEDQSSGSSHEDDENWRFGPNGIAHGSLHCDVWTGPAVDLASRDMLVVKPVGGWWRDQDAETRGARTRYALVLTLKCDDASVDLYTPIETAIDIQNTIDVQI